MKIRETFQVKSSAQEVWDFISDPHKMGSCLPSVQSVEMIDERHYRATIKQKVGFISATFQIQTEVVDKDPPARLVLSSKAKTIAGADGRLSSTSTIHVRSINERMVEITVDSDVTLGGQLAILGAKLIESKSKEIFAEASANLKAKLEGQRNAELPGTGVSNAR